MTPFLLRALDVDLELDPGPDSPLAAALLAHLPASWSGATGPRPGRPRLALALASRGGRQTLAAEGELLAAAAAGAERGKWLARLAHEVVTAVARRSHFLWLHAGAVGWRSRALVLPGSPFAGKSTLVAALLERGARYLSDEWVAVDDGGRVHPLPRPLRLREGRGPAARRAVAGALPLAATALFSYRPRPAPPPVRLSPADSLAALAGHCLGAEKLGDQLAAAAALLRRPFFAGFRGEAAATADWLLQLSEENGDAA